ncbi:MAG: C25 family cysteine peptidase [Kiritimatiellia bacterium]
MRIAAVLALGFASALAAPAGYAADADSLVRTAEQARGAEEAVVFAVPDGYTFAGAAAVDGENGASAEAVAGASFTMNHVALVPVKVADTNRAYRITATFNPGGHVFTGNPAKVIRRQIRAIVANPDDVPLTRQSTASAAVSARASVLAAVVEEEAADVLILTPVVHTNLWQQYVAVRAAAHPELTFKIKDTSSIYAEYPYDAAATDGTPRNPAESIHKYLRENRDTLGLSYLILGGSWIDPMKLDEENCWINSNGERIYYQTGETVNLTNAIPSVRGQPRTDVHLPADSYYSCLDLMTVGGETQLYPWCTNNAEYTYTCYLQDFAGSTRLWYDCGADLVVARIPLKPLEANGRLYTPAELMASLLGKIARGEADDFDGTGDIGLMWARFGWKSDVDGTLCDEYEFFDDAPNMFATYRPTRTFEDTELNQRRITRNEISKDYPVVSVDAVNSYAWTLGQPTAADATDKFFASDHDYMVADAHGWALGAECQLSAQRVREATGLTLFYDVSVPCETGYQDYVTRGTDEMADRIVTVACLGESAVGAPLGGAVASVNNTRYGWSGGVSRDDNPAYELLSYKLGRNLMRAFVRQGRDAGEAWLYSHLKFIGADLSSIGQGGLSSTAIGNTGAWVLFEHTLFGDPFIRQRAQPSLEACELETFPHVASNVVFAAAVANTGTNAVVDAATAGDIAFSGSGRFKIMNELKVGGTVATFNDGLEGGIGRQLVFTNLAGTVKLHTTRRFYLGGLKNAEALNVYGSNAIIDFDRIDGSTLKMVLIDSPVGATNVLRSTLSGAAAGIAIAMRGGTVEVESPDLFGNTSVQMQAATLRIGVNPKAGPLVTSSEPLSATFSGSGTIVVPKGTSTLKNFIIADGSAIDVVEEGEIALAFRYSGQLGASPTGWFSNWTGENFTGDGVQTGVLGPDGFVRVISADAHPYYGLPGKRGFSVALYADLSRVTNNNAVMLGFGNYASSQLLLVRGQHGKIRLEATNAYNASIIDYTDYIPYPGDGYHLYIVSRGPDAIGFYVDGRLVGTLAGDLNLKDGFGLGSVGSTDSREMALRGRTVAEGMAIGEVRGFDAVLGADDAAALAAELPVVSMPYRDLETIDLNTEKINGVLSDATFADGAYLGGSKGTITIPSNTLVNVDAVQLLNTSDGSSDFALDIAGTLNVRGETSDKGVYYDFKNGNIAGIMMGHWAGSSRILVGPGGELIAPKSLLLINYDAKGEQLLAIDGGYVRVKGVTNDALNQGGWVRDKTGDFGTVRIGGGGKLEVDSWPVHAGGNIGTMPIILEGGAIAAAADWTCPWPLTVEAETNTVDCAGHDIVLTGDLEGSGTLVLADSSAGKTGSILFLGSLDKFGGKLLVDSSLAAFGVPAGMEACEQLVFDEEGLPARRIVRLGEAQILAGYTSPYPVVGGSQIVFTDEAGHVYQESDETNVFTPRRLAELVLTGEHLNLDLTVYTSTVQRVVLNGVTGYFDPNNTVYDNCEIEFREPASGAAFTRTNGYSNKKNYFPNVFGEGTITASGTIAPSQMMVFTDPDCQFAGSILLPVSTCRMQLVFGADKGTAGESRIDVLSGYTARLKDGGEWQANTIFVSGTLNCRGRAHLAANSIDGGANIVCPEGYRAVDYTAGGSVREIWILPEGEKPAVDSFTVSNTPATIPGMDIAGVWTIAEGVSATLAPGAVVTCGGFVNGGTLNAAAKIGNAFYADFADAAAAAGGTETIELLADTTWALALGEKAVVLAGEHVFTPSVPDGAVLYTEARGEAKLYAAVSSVAAIAYVVDGQAADDLAPLRYAPELLPLDLPVPATATNQVFRGWYKTADFSGAEFSALAEGKGDLTLYGRFTEAVARVDGVNYDSFESALAAQVQTASPVQVIGEQTAPDGYFIRDSILHPIAATVTVTDAEGAEDITVYESFAAARTAAKDVAGAIIELRRDTSDSFLVATGETVVVRMNGFAFLEPPVAESSFYRVVQTTDADTGITIFETEHRGYVFLSFPNLPDGIRVTRVIAIVGDEEREIDPGGDGTYQIPYPGEVRISYTQEGAWIIADQTLDATETDLAVEIIPDSQPAIARRGEKYYLSAADALADAGNADPTVTLIADPTYAGITLPAGITFDLNGVVPSMYIDITSEGGTIRNSGAAYAKSQTCIRKLTLKADTRIEGNQLGVMYGGTKTTLTLNGHTLTIALDDDNFFYFYYTVVSDDGEIVLESGILTAASSFASNQTTTIPYATLKVGVNGTLRADNMLQGSVVEFADNATIDCAAGAPTFSSTVTFGSTLRVLGSNGYTVIKGGTIGTLPEVVNRQAELQLSDKTVKLVSTVPALLDDWTFKGASLTSTGTNAKSLTSEGSSAVYLYSSAYTYSSALNLAVTPYCSYSYPEEWTVLAAGIMPAGDHVPLFTLGTLAAGGFSLLSTNNTSVLLTRHVNGSTHYEVWAEIPLHYPRELRHTYALTRTAGMLRLLIDGQEVWGREASIPSPGGGLQIGSIHGGVGGTGLIKATGANVGDGCLEALRIYGGASTDKLAVEFAAEFPNDTTLCTLAYVIDGEERTDLGANFYRTTALPFRLPLPTIEDGKIFCGWYLTEDMSGPGLRTIAEPSGDLRLYGGIIDATITIEDVVIPMELFIDDATNERRDPFAAAANGLFRWQNTALGIDENVALKIVTFENARGQLRLGDNLTLNPPEGITAVRQLETSEDLATWQTAEGVTDGDGNYLIPVGDGNTRRFYRIRYRIGN